MFGEEQTVKETDLYSLIKDSKMSLREVVETVKKLREQKEQEMGAVEIHEQQNSMGEE